MCWQGGEEASDIGGGRSGRSNGTLKNSSGVDVDLRTYSIWDADEPISFTELEGVSGYGLNDVVPMDDKLYFYLPKDAAVSGLLTDDGREYTLNYDTFRLAHQWTYTADGDTITMTCSRHNGETATRTITANATNFYTGTPLRRRSRMKTAKRFP